MHVLSQHILRQICEPGSPSAQREPNVASGPQPFSIAQILHPAGPALLVADLISPSAGIDPPPLADAP